MPQRLGRYLLLEKIGQGGMAEVFAARLEGPAQFARTCVIKRLRPELAQMPHQVQLFLEEARLSAMLQHPCVVQVFDVGEGENGQVFFAMERIDGPSLARVEEVLWRDRAQLPVDVAAWIGARTAEGLHFAHELVDKGTGKPLHIAHRDVSPHNILLGMLGDVKVADFGIAKADVEHRPQTRIGITKGKLAYMSPEQARGERVDRRTDVYALGVVLWEMFAGQPLVEDRAQRRKLEMGRVPAPSSMRTDVDPALDAIVLQALEPLPKDRTPSCRHIEDALDRWLADHGPQARAKLSALLRDRQGELIAPPETTQTKPMALAPPPPAASSSSTAASSPWARTPARAVSANAKTVVKGLAAPDSFDGFSDETTRPQIDVMSGLDTKPRGIPAPPPTSPDGSAEGSADGGADGGVSRRANGNGAGRVDDAKGTVAVKAGSAAVPLPMVPEAGPPIPSPSTSFIGRKRELDTVGLLLDEGARLVTLLGPGGTGKTRVALRFAELRAAERTLPGGVWFVDLTDAKDAASAQSTIARALGVPLRAGRSSSDSQTMLGHALAALGRALIVLDSCDGLAPRHADVIADLLRRAPRARFLATSQQLLGIAGESALHVGPLPVPSDAHDAARGEGALELFLERARAARNGHALSDASHGVVAEIVRKLDGVPLAIELAAARAATETPNEILRRLGLGSDARTLKAAIGETYAQLADDEKRAFRQASVFRGGFTLEAADAVFELGDDDPHAQNALERLKGRSLVVTRGARFFMLEALRAFATERLEEALEKSATEARHAGFFVSLGKKLADDEERLAAEVENLSAVVERAAQSTRASTAAATLALEAALALEPVLAQRASAAEQLALLEKALALAEGRGVADKLRMRGHLARGEARRLLGSFDQARADLHTAVDLATQQGDAAAEGRALASLGALSLSQGKLELAEDTLARALALTHGAGDDKTAGRTLAQLGKVSRLRRRLDEAEERCRRAVELSRAAGDKRAAGRAYVELASALLSAQKLDDVNGAARAANEAVRILALLNDRRSLVHAWGTLAVVELDRRHWDDAESAAARAVDLAVRVGERKAEGLYVGIRGSALHGKGALLDARELYTQAARALFDAGEDGHGAFFTGALGAVNAALDDVKSAAQNFAVAERRLRTAERPLLSSAVSLFESMLQLAQAGDAASRTAARDELRRRIDVVMQASPPAASTPAPSQYASSEELRFATRVARAALG